jgi:hypothetical protein
MNELWGFNVRQNHIHDSDDKPFHQTSRSRRRMVFSGYDQGIGFSDEDLKGMSIVINKLREPERDWKKTNRMHVYKR